MALPARTAQQHELNAQRFWAQLNGNISNVINHASSNSRSILVTASNALAEAVAALLSENGITAEVQDARHAAALPEGSRCMTVLVSHGESTTLALIVPGDPAVRCYPGNTTGDLCEPEQVRQAVPGSDGWVSAASIAEQLHTL